MSKDITLQRLNIDTDHIVYFFLSNNNGSFYDYITSSVNQIYNNTLISNLSTYRNNGSLKFIPRFKGNFDIDIEKKKKGALEKIILDAFDDNPERLSRFHEKIMSYDGSFVYDDMVRRNLEEFKKQY